MTQLAPHATHAQDEDRCRRCQGKGEIKAYQHVKAGVCFRCWGCGLDLPTIEKRLEMALEEVRREYRKARRAGAAESVLAQIVVRGKRAARAYNAQCADSAVLKRAHQTV